MGNQTQAGGVSFGQGNTIAVTGDIVAGDKVAGSKIVGYTAKQVTSFIAQIGASFQPKPFDGRCPYVGLAAFEEQDADRFFGREPLIAGLVARIAKSRFVFIAGPSGSGKSSLVRAGLIPALRRGRQPASATTTAPGILGSDRWLYESLRPGRHPLDELARVTAGLAGALNAGDDIKSKGRTDPTILHQWAEIALKDDRSRRAVLLIDQFEETFTQVSDETERAAFIALLARAATAENGRVIVLFTMRSDFISECARYPQLNALLSQEFIQVGAMSPDELVRAIAMPALQVGLRIDPDLIAQVVNEMGDEPGALPLMQFALKDLFDSQQAKGGVIALTLADYLARGGLRKSLQRHADAEFALLSGSEQALARSVFTNLIQIGAQPTRRRAMFDELVPAGADPASVQAVVRKLADARLITTDTQADQDTVTIVHERLIEAWPWLQNLVEDNREVIALQSKISDDAATWETNKRDPSYLYTGARLATAQEQLAAKKLSLSSPARAFIDAGVKARDAARIRRQRITIGAIAGLAVVAVIFAGLAVWALFQTQEARTQQALSRSRELAATVVNVNQLRDFPERALLLALELNADPTLPRTYESQDALRQAFLAWNGRAMLSGHTDAVESAQFSPDGKRVVTASDDGTARIWDAATKQTLATLRGHAGWVTRAAFSPDGQQVVTAGRDGTARLWDAASGAQIKQLNGHAGPLNNAQFSPDGQRVVTAGDDGTARVWDAATGAEIEDKRLASSGPVRDAQFSPDGAAILTADANNLVQVRDISGETVEPVYETTVDQVNSARFSPDGARIVTADRDGLVQVWGLDDPTQPKLNLRGHTLWAYGAQFSADGRHIVSASKDQTARIWDADTGVQEQMLVGHANFVADAQFSPDGRFVVTAGNDRVARVWDAGVGRAEDDLLGHLDAVYSAHFSPDGSRIATGSGDGTARVWNAATGETLAVITHTGPILDAVFSPDRARLLTAGTDGASLWSAVDRAPIARLNHDAVVFSAQFSPGGGQAVTAGSDGAVHVWDAATGAEIGALRSHSGTVTLARFSPDGKRIVTAGRDGTAHVWDFGNGRDVALKGHIGAVNSAAFSPDGQRVVTGGDDNTVRVWDANTGQQLVVMDGHSRPVNDVLFSADGKRILSAGVDQTARLWDAATGEPGPVMQGHLREVYRARFSPDGKTIVTASGDGAARLFDAATGVEVAALRGHGDAVYSAEFSPDGKQVVTASQDGTARRHWADIGDVIRLARERITRQPPELLCDERQQVLHEEQACPAATPAPTPKP